MISFHQVGKIYSVKGQKNTALHPINLHINDGQIFGIIGHSGAGKSTLLRLINRIEEPSSGTIVVNNKSITQLDSKELRSFRRQAGMIFQHFNLLSSKTVVENIAMPLKLSGEYSSDAIKKRVTELLDLVELTEHAAKYPAQLSGGQKQRVGIARSLATEPSVLLCDEATSALDPQTTTSVLSLLEKLNRELNLTIVLITHEMDVIRRICDQVAVMDSGNIVEQGAVSDVFLYPKHSTTKKFVSESEHIDENEQQSSFANVLGTIIRLTFQGETTYSPLLGYVARKTGIDFSILSGRIDRIKNIPYGQLTLALSGGDIKNAITLFNDSDVHLEVLR